MKKMILIITMMMLIGCDSAEGGGKSTTPEMNSTIVTPKEQTLDGYKYPKDVEWTYVEINLDDLSFEDAFDIEYRAKGEGHTFWWNGEQYTTNLHTGSIVTSGWVRNSDDIDDNCYSNEWDICGKCDGTGMITWYKDNDGDGLGDINKRVLDCKNPSVDEE